MMKGKGSEFGDAMLIGRCFFVITFAICGCATPGDPSCAVYDEITDRSSLKEVLYSPDLDPVGLNQTSWYNCPTAWNPACPGVECRHRDARRTTPLIDRDASDERAPKASAADEVPPPPLEYD